MMKKILLLAILSVNICLPGPLDFIVDNCKAQSDIAKLSNIDSISGRGKKVRIQNINDYEAPTIKSSTATMQQRPTRQTGRLPKIESVQNVPTINSAYQSHTNSRFGMRPQSASIKN